MWQNKKKIPLSSMTSKKLTKWNLEQRMSEANQYN